MTDYFVTTNPNPTQLAEQEQTERAVRPEAVGIKTVHCPVCCLVSRVSGLGNLRLENQNSELVSAVRLIDSASSK